MATQRLTKHNAAIVAAAFALVRERKADAMLLMLDGSTDWKRIAEMADGIEAPIIIAVDSPEDLEGAAEAGLKPLALNKEKAPLLERLQHALLEAAADELIRTKGEVVAVYSGFQQGRLDSISHLQLDERMRRLTSRDLQMLESRVPLQTIKAVIDLAARNSFADEAFSASSQTIVRRFPSFRTREAIDLPSTFSLNQFVGHHAASRKPLKRLFRGPLG